MQFWNELEGQEFEGFYPLRRLMRAEGRTAWFETKADGDRPAAISLTECLTDADEVLGRLETARNLRHPNLLAISKVGRVRLDNTLCVYALMEYPEQNLSEIIREQTLSKDEAQQVAEALVDGLTAIHQQGFAHGRVEPASVLAVGESVKLRSDCLQSPGSSRAGDISGLGATLFQALTQQKADGAGDTQINRLPAPFAEIVRNSLNSRWGLPQISAALHPASAAAPSAAPSPSGAPSLAPAAGSRTGVPAGPATEVVTGAATAQNSPAASAPRTAPVVAAAAVSPAKPAARETQPSQGQPIPPRAAGDEPSGRTLSSRKFNEESGRDQEQPGTSSRPVALYAIVGAVALILLLWIIFRWIIFRPSHHSPPATATKAQVSAPASPLEQKPSAVLSSPRPTPSPAPVPSARESANRKSAAQMSQGSTPAATRPNASTGNGIDAADRPVWRVVAFTYNRQDQAQHKADEIEQQHRDLRVSVFTASQSSGHPRFLVTIGGTMDRSRALALRDRAAGLGLPADTYIQNFSQ